MMVRELRVSYVARPDLPAMDGSIRTPGAAARFLAPILSAEPSECFLVVALTTKHAILSYHEVSRGSLDATVVHPREVFRAGILANAAAIIIAHNHPSGDPTPSPDDVAMTERLRRAGEIMGIEVVDHVIIGDEGRYFSFLECGRFGSPVC